MKQIQEKITEINAKIEELRPQYPDKTEGQLRLLAIKELNKK
jgi:hypothetical protein